MTSEIKDSTATVVISFGDNGLLQKRDSLSGEGLASGKIEGSEGDISEDLG